MFLRYLSFRVVRHCFYSLHQVRGLTLGSHKKGLHALRSFVFLFYRIINKFGKSSEKTLDKRQNGHIMLLQAEQTFYIKLCYWRHAVLFYLVACNENIVTKIDYGC